ncbi:MAG: metal-dependent hydrolase [Armatimonadota bacterium]|nr:metal-dependent hydrolase [Armatimonadota bacterium]
MVKATFLGHACVLVSTESHSVVIDPFLTGNPKAAAKPEDLKVDAVIVTHGHGDHLGDAIEIANRNNCPIISVFELVTYCQNKGAKQGHPLHIGGSYSFPFGKVKFVPAWHGSAFVEQDGTIVYTGNPAGVLLFMDGKTVYHAGDTGLFGDMKLIGERHPIDLAFLPIGGNFTMDIDDAVEAVKLLNPKTVVPIHYGTFPIIEADPNEFAQKVKETCPSTEVKILQPSESVNL